MFSFVCSFGAKSHCVGLLGYRKLIFSTAIKQFGWSAWVDCGLGSKSYCHLWSNIYAPVQLTADKQLKVCAR